MQHHQKSIAITDRSSIGEARRSAIHAAQTLGFDEEHRSNIGIVSTEAATNMLLHGREGELLICPNLCVDGAWLDLIALDSGPGIRDVSRAMEDGYSTIGTAGQGMGAIQRISDTCSLYSAVGKGTAFWCRFVRGRIPATANVGVVSLPIKGETVAGDSYLVLERHGRTIYVVVDGLGHGAGATEASQEAVTSVERHFEQPATVIIERAHDALKKTRGAALSIAIFESADRTLTYAGVGNVSAIAVTASASRSLVTQNGTLGAVMPRSPQQYVYPVEPDTTLIMFSDGLTSKVSPAGYPGILHRPPGLLAALLYRDFSRRRDDATVLVAKLGDRS
ncbi:ATP-binding protein/SpoIIE family protein phosphatase [Edaphobacter paludis]|uniref:ATP-binding protein/SpoIIE family protein phosphatase n=1 Tax=Edaphobacter paludis TaxID=3035702 RepID=A0AAU7DBX7_9BACT